MKDGNAKSFFIKVIDVTVSQNLYFFGAPFSKWYEQKRAEDFGKVYPRIPLFLQLLIGLKLMQPKKCSI